MGRRWICCLGLLAACTTSEPRVPASPTTLDESAMALSAPGVQRGPWLQAGTQSDLLVESIEATPLPSDRLEPFTGRTQDVYRLTVRGSCLPPVLFPASHGKFRIGGVDVDGDGVWEIAIEHALGRGTFATTRELLVLRRGEREYVSVLSAELVEYFWPQSVPPGGHGKDPLVVERGYTFARSASGRLLVRLRLGPVPDVRGRLLTEAQLAFLQRQQIDLEYNPALTSFEVVGFLFQPLPRHARQERGS